MLAIHQKLFIARLVLILALLATMFGAMPAGLVRAEPFGYRAAPGGATSGDCGGDWANPCDLQYLLSVLTGEAEIWLKEGTYKPGTDRNSTFSLRDGIAIYGGFAGTETTRDQRDPSFHTTILSGDLNGDDNSSITFDEPTRAENALHVVASSSVGNTAILDGVTVTGGNANLDSGTHMARGGGMWNGSGSPTLTNVTFSSNSSLELGGGMFNENNSQPVLTDVYFVNNTSEGGGGLMNYRSSPVLINVVLASNYATYSGGGVLNANQSHATFTNVTFQGNSAFSFGGGMSNYESNPTISNSTFGNNAAFGGSHPIHNHDQTAPFGGGIYNYYSNALVVNSTFSNNRAGNETYPNAGSAVGNHGSNPTLTHVTISEALDGIMNDASNPVVRSSIIWRSIQTGDMIAILDMNNSSSIVSDSVIWNGFPGGTNIITADPSLGSLSNDGSDTETMPLQQGSSAIDQADPTYCPAADQRGVARPQGPGCDVGAYEYVEYTISGSTGLGGVDIYYSGYYAGGMVTSDDSGNYSFSAPYNWTGMVTAFKAGYRFTPEERSYSNVQSDQLNQDFTPARLYTISGNVGVGGATLSYEDGGFIRSVGTYSNGDYSIQVPEHWTGTITPSKTDYVFEPASRSYLDVQEEQPLQNYVATQTRFTISGNVRHGGVTLSYMEGDILKTVVSDSSGNYFLKVDTGWSGTVTPSKAGVIFDPISRNYLNVQSNQTTQNYKASIPVTTTADSGPGSLRDAIINAVYGDVITFHPDLSGQTITLASTLGIGKGLTINGAGLDPRIEISGNGSVQIFSVDPRYDPAGPRDVKFHSLVLKNGKRAMSIGGGNILIENVAFVNNSAYDGGAISSCCYNTTIRIVQSTFDSNSAEHYGGAIFTQFGSLTVQGSTFTNNTSGSVGGAVAVERQGPYTFEDNTFMSNSGLSGGAIRFESVENSVIVRRNLFSGNKASLNGGAIFELLSYSTASFNIENNTFYANEAVDKGGGIIISNGAVLRNNTFSNNKAAAPYGGSAYLGAAYLYNNILANNTGGGECYASGYGTVTGSNNLIEGGAVNCVASITADPMLGSLADNGGSTKTMALLLGSPAIDAGSATNCPSTDQRGVARPHGSGCDLGSYEYEPPATPTPTITPTYTPTNTQTNTPTPTVTPLYSYHPLYLSLTGNQTIGGIASSDEDILRFDGTNWSLFFDGSDVGVGSPDLFAFSLLDADTILMSFSASVTVNGITATPQDVLRFDATSLGSTTSGTWSLYFDGSDVGFDTSAEKIDSLTVLPDGRLLLSTTGNPSLPGLTTGRDEDVLAFTPTSLGTVTAGSWSMYFDGSDVGLADSSDEDVDALDVVNGQIYLSTLGNFAVNGLSGADEDVFVCTWTSLGDTTACTYSSPLYFDGSTWGLAGNDVDAFNFMSAGPVPTSTIPGNTPTATGTPTRTPTAQPSTSTPTPSSTPTPPLFIQIVQPNGGEILTVGTTYRITWNSSPNIDMVTIGYKSCDSCLDWIVTNIPNVGYYDWNVNVGNTTNTQFKIDITGYDTGIGSTVDLSDNYFTVLQSPTSTATHLWTSTPAITNTSTTTPVIYGYFAQPDATGGIDASIQSNSATNFGTEVAIGVGENNNANRVSRVLIKFDVSMPANATIVSAKLSLWTASDLSDHDRTLRVYRLKVPFVESQATWNTAGGGVNWQVPGASGTSDRENIEIGSVQILANEPIGVQKEITLSPAMVQEWVSGAFTNNGLIIVVDTELNDRFNYKSSDTSNSTQRPRLIIQYTLP